MNAVDMSFVMLQEKSAAPARTNHFPSTEQLLTEGGDARIALNPASKTNQYGCSPKPDARIAAFGSATASTISEDSYFAANQLRNRLVLNITREDAAEIYADQMNRIRQELSDLCGLRNSGVDIVFAASGTDVHLIASQLAAKHESVPLRMLMVDTMETGGGVTAALSGRHFSNRTALGESVAQGAKIGRTEHGQVVAIPLRLADGTPRPSADIDADFERQVAEAVAAGERVLLTMVDVSKTGMIVPSVKCAVDLHRRYSSKLDVLVDACQFRLAPVTLQKYLAQGFLVGITGSKFISGPSFSGALLIPSSISKELRACARVGKLQEYSARADWPVGWSSSKSLYKKPNFGLLLRWEGAIKELRAFHSLSNIVTMHFLQNFADAIKQHMKDNPIFELLPVPELQRFDNVQGWDNIQTIFPFLLTRPAGEKGKALLNSEEMVQVYHALQEESNGLVQLAQPVDCGRRGVITVSALRLCVSSRLVVEAMQQNGRNQKVVIERALKALDKVAKLAREM